MRLYPLTDLPALLGKNQCLLGIDYGSKIIGVAVSDPNLCVASPIASIARKKFAQDAVALSALIRERTIGALVVGWPKTMEGGDSGMAQAARAFIRNLSQFPDFPTPDMPVSFWDERFSTAAVQRFMISDDMSRKKRASTVDKAAAAYILQGALDFLRHNNSSL